MLNIETPETVLTANGATVAFATGFSFVNATEVRVSVEIDGVVSDKTLDTHYTLGAGDWPNDGATITFTAGNTPPNGARVIIRRVTPASQGEAFGDQERFRPQQAERAWDKLTRMAQEAAAEVDRTLKVPVGESGLEIARIADRANRLLVFGENGEPDWSRTLAAFDADVAQTAADREQTGLDRIQTAADRGQASLAAAIATAASLLAAQAAADAVMVSGIDTARRASVDSAFSLPIEPAVQTLMIDHYAPSYVEPATLTGGGAWVRMSKSDIDAAGYPALAWRRHDTDRGLPDLSTDEEEGGYFVQSAEAWAPERFGALGGGALETDAIQAAFAMAELTGKPALLTAGKEYFAAGVTPCNGSIVGPGATFKGRLSCVASGVKWSGFKVHAMGPVAISLPGETDARLSGVHLDGMSVEFDMSTTVLYREAIVATCVDRLKITESKITYGISLRDCPDYSIQNNYLDGAGDNHSELIHASMRSDGTISGNSFNNAYDNWIDLYSSGERTVITGNRFNGMGGYLGTGIEIKVSMSDDPGNTSGDALGWSEQIIIKGNYFGGFVAASNVFMSYISIYYVDSRAAPSFSYQNAPRNIIVALNIFDGFDATLHGTGYFAGLILNKATACTVQGNIFRNMALGASGQEWSSCIWIEDCEDLIITGNRGAMKGGCGISYHGTNRRLTVSDNHLLPDVKSGIRNKYGMAAVKVGSRAAPVLENCTFRDNKVDGTTMAFRQPYVADGAMTDCKFRGNEFLADSLFAVPNRCDFKDNTFRALAAGNFSVYFGNATTIGLGNAISGNRTYSAVGSPKIGIVIQRLRGGPVKDNIARLAGFGIYVLGSGTAGELDYLNIKDNYSYGQTATNFPEYASMHASDTVTLQASNNQKIAA